MPPYEQLTNTEGGTQKKKGVAMVPLVQEAYGRLGEEAENTLTRLSVFVSTNFW